MTLHISDARTLASMGLWEHSHTHNIMQASTSTADLAWLTHGADGGVAQPSTDASHTAGQHSTQAVGVEGGAKDGLDRVLQDGGDLVTA